jgi:hypothetical protein
MLTQDAWIPVDRGGLVNLIVEKSGIDIKSKLLLLLTFPTISMSHDIYDNCIKFDYHYFSILFVIGQIMVGDPILSQYTHWINLTRPWSSLGRGAEPNTSKVAGQLLGEASLKCWMILPKLNHIKYGEFP